MNQHTSIFFLFDGCSSNDPSTWLPIAPSSWFRCCCCCTAKSSSIWSKSMLYPSNVLPSSDHRFDVPTTWFDGILFQGKCFMVALGCGVCCWGRIGALLATYPDDPGGGGGGGGGLKSPISSIDGDDEQSWCSDDRITVNRCYRYIQTKKQHSRKIYITFRLAYDKYSL